MLRATRCRSGFSPLLSVRALLSRRFCATAIFESDASPPDPLVHFSQQLHTSDHDQHRTTNGIFHPAKSHRLPPAFRPCPPVCEQTERTVTEAGSPQWRFSAVPHATFSPCRTLRFHAVRASKHTARGLSPFCAIGVHSSRRSGLSGARSHQADSHVFEAHGRPAFLHGGVGLFPIAVSRSLFDRKPSYL
ncbi:MAG: hypothetical protein DESF_01542 [Desulfovibrio sp.]